MNSEPLSPPHGYLLRLIVPGWYAVRPSSDRRYRQALRGPLSDGEVLVPSSSSTTKVEPGEVRPTMRRFSTGLMGALLGISLVTAVVEQSDAKVALARTERCSNLSRQFDEALETHARDCQEFCA